MKHTTNLTADGSNAICTAVKAAGKDRFFATVSVIGTFGSGTLTIQYSPDGGTTKLDVLKADDNALAFTANGGYNFELGYGGSQDAIIVYATLTGSTTPNINVIIHDNAA